MSIDGPGATESPYTVDAGHFQVEMMLFGYTSEQETSENVTYRLDEWSIGSTMLKLGLLNSLDVELVLEPYTHVYEREDDWRETRSGFGDTSIRLKYNLWGNDGGRTALALVPYVSFPTGTSDLGGEGVQGGLLLPFGLELPTKSYLGLTPGFLSADNLFSSGRHAEFRNSIAFFHEAFSRVELYVEFFSVVSTEEDSEWVGTIGPGFSFWVTDNFLLNAGFSAGVTPSADNWHTSFGFAWRY